MRVKSRYGNWAGSLILLVIGVIPLDAGIRPSFNLDQCSWHATHIVLVKTTAKDAIFSVVESWKGDLKPGDSLELPELKPNENAVPISSYPKSVGFNLEDKLEISEQFPRQPIGSRMILFLKRQVDGGAASPSAGIGTGIQWGAASEWGGIKVSVLWIDGGKAFCFQQWMNPGPSTLSQCIRWPVTSSDVDVFTARIQEVLQTQRNLTETLALKKADARARRLGRIALGDVYEAQKEAIDSLGMAGTVALPEILQVMDKPPGFYDGAQLIRGFVEAAGKDSGRQLHARLQQDLIYWKTIGPTLTQDWVDQLVEPSSPLFVKFNETELLIRELDQEHYVQAVQTVVELRDFWISQPQLYDVHHYAFGLVKECEAFVMNVGVKEN